MSTGEEALTGALTAAGGSADRLQAALGSTADLLSLEACHLYVREGDAGSYRLAAGWSNSASGKHHEGRDDLTLGASPTGGVQAAGDTPGLELPVPGPQDLQPVPTLVGTMLPLRLTVPGQLDAVLLMAPLQGRLRLSARRRLDRLRTPLGHVVAALHRETALARELDTATALVESGRRLRDSTLAPDRFLRLLLDLAVRATASEGGFVAVSDPQGRLALRVAENLPHRPEELDVTPETGVFDWSLADTGALLLRRPEEAARLGLRSMLAVPLLGPAGPLGVVALSTHSRRAAFTEHNLRLLELLAEQVGLMLENERIFADFSSRYLRVLQGIARTLDARRPETVGYHERTGRLAAALARALDLDPSEVAAVHQAGLIHDVGLAAVPASDRAFLADIEHPVVGADLVEGMLVDPRIARAVATHHEWFDGWGFPSGLRGTDIPLEGRVLALASFCAEMSNPSVVRAAWSADQVAEEARQRAGSQFDPAIVEAGTAVLIDELVADDTARKEAQ